MKSLNFFPNWGSIDTNQSKTGFSIACCSNAAVGLNIDLRAGWERTKHGLLTNLTWFSGRAWRGNARFCAPCYCSVASVRGPGVRGWALGGRRLAGLVYFAEISEAAYSELGIVELCARIILRIIDDLPHNWANPA